MRKKLLVNVINQVNASQIRTVTEQGDEWLVVPSATLPDNVVMNGGLYPAEEIAKSYATLNGTHAPVEHPQDRNGQYILCGQPAAMINGYLVGAENRNVKRENGRVFCEKWIHVRTALSSERGKRLVDRINALAAGQGEPIHTSTGLLLEREELAEPLTNTAGQQYNWIARNMFFDHDAILLDNPGAATPSQGVGIGVNANGEELERMVVNAETVPMADSYREQVQDARAKWEEARTKVQDALRAQLAIGDDSWLFVEDINAQNVIYETQAGQYAAGYQMADDGTVTLDALPHDKVQAMTLWQKVANSLRKLLPRGYNENDQDVNTKEDQEMRDQIIAALNAAGVATDGLNEAQLLAEHTKLVSKPLADQLAAVNARLDAQDNAKRAALIEQIGDKSGLSANTLQSLPLGELEALATKAATPAATTVGLNAAFTQPAAGAVAGSAMPE